MLIKILALEMSLGGGGQLFLFSGISTRYIILILCTLLGIINLFLGFKIPRAFLYSLIAISLYLTIGFLVGLINGYSIESILSVMLQYSTWSLLIFILSYLSYNKIVIIDRIFIFSGLFLASLYLTYQIGCFVGISAPDKIYESFGESTEFFFRGEQYFFYKGFFYFGIAALLLNNENTKFKSFLIFILITATALMSLRGLLFALLISLIIQFFLLKKYIQLSLFASFGIISIFIAFVAIPNSIDSFGALRALSDENRINDILTVLNNVNLVNLFIGNGFGSLINDRILIENSFLDIFVKTGLFGLMLYIFPILFILYLYFPRNYDFELRNRCIGYFSCLIFILFSSLTNPFINNTIGIFLINYILVAFYICYKHSKTK